MLRHPSRRAAARLRPASPHRVGPAARFALCALLCACWHAPALARGEPVDVRPRGTSAGDADVPVPSTVASATFLFAFGARTPAGLDGDELDGLLTRLGDERALRLRIDAHTDNVGWALGNVELSRLRARAVAQEILARGVAVERLQARAFGESRPVASNATVEGRRLNRRVEVSLVR